MPWHEREYYREESGGFGGGGRFGRFNAGSVVGWLLIINAVIWVLDLILTHGTRSPWWLSPSYWGAFSVETGIFEFQVWRLLTYQFLHGGIFHLFFNMLALYFFGPLMEQWWGSRRFLAFYLLCGASGAVVYTLIVLTVPDLIFDVARMAAAGVSPRQIPVVGASGAIFAILVGAAVLYPRQRVMLLIPPIPMSLRTMAMIFLGIAALSIIFGAPGAGGEVAHLGGALLGYILVKFPRSLDWVGRVSPETWRDRVERARRQRRSQREQQLDQEVDRILEKVKDEGLQSLTRREKRILNQATEQSRRRAG